MTAPAQTLEVRIDLRVGGRHELTMVHRDTGEQIPVGYEILELDPPSHATVRHA